MKKILMITAILVMVASSSFAADVTSTANGDIVAAFAATGLELHGASTGVTADKTTAMIGKASTGVAVGWRTSTIGYALITQHKSGTKAYGSSYDSTSLYQTIASGEPGVVIDASPSVIDTTDFVAAAWKAM
jgi:hypothetical protein